MLAAAFGAPLTATAEMAVYSNCNAAPRREYSRVGTAIPQHESLRGFWEPESIFERFLNAEVGIKVSNSRNLQRFLWSFQTDAGVNRNFRLPTTSASVRCCFLYFRVAAAAAAAAAAVSFDDATGYSVRAGYVSRAQVTLQG